jgi:hypothetical protein
VRVNQIVEQLPDAFAHAEYRALSQVPRRGDPSRPASGQSASIACHSFFSSGTFAAALAI